MDSTRQQKYSKLIQKEVSDIFQHEGRNYYGSAFVTITNVRITPDLGIAFIRVSLFKEKDPQKIVDSINKHAPEIRKKLGQRIKNQARHIPELKFFIDDSLDYVDKMDAIFKNLDIPKEENGNQGIG